MKIGLTSQEAAEKLKTFGYNELDTTKPKNILHILLEVVKEPMFLLLICCGILYMILGDYTEGFILLSTIFIIIFITFYQYQKTEKALESLRKLASPRALVIRDGNEIRISGREVVPDDWILVNEGDRIPADSILIQSTHIAVDESLLTGESVPVIKETPAEFNQTPTMLYSGTLVVQGKGLAKVLHTGVHTQFGKIGTTLQQIEQEPTRLQKEMKILIRNLFLIGGLISVAVVMAYYFTRGNFIQSLLNGLAGAMAILPEEFPVVLTVFLALGAWRLSKKNVLTRKPSAIETLGSATVLCSDKTGTITQNKMEVAAIYYRHQLIEKNDYPQKTSLIQDIVEAAYFASPSDSIDPMEKAIIHLHHAIIPSPHAPNICIKEYPLSKNLLAMTRVLHQPSASNFQIYTKGAPEAILELCRMNNDEASLQLSYVNQLAEKGYRVIAVAKAQWEKNDLPVDQKNFEYTFMGLIGLEDPIRPEVPQAIQECREAGIQVIMITGDFPATAKSIAHQVGLPTNGNLVTGSELNELSESQLKEIIKSTHIFARIVPEQKLQIIKALKANGEIVAMTGDGVNDAPALKAADIGIAMGGKGTDVAREASSLVLLDDNFTSIVAAIRLGRKIYDNLQKAMSYIIAIHIPIIGLALLPSIFPSLPLLLMPLHIVFMELIIDPICSIAFESEEEEIGIMRRPPRFPHEQFFGWKKMFFSLFQGLLLLSMTLVIYFLSLKEGHTPGEVRAITFSSLIIGNVFLILTSLSKTRHILSILLEKNIAVLIILIFAVIILMLIIYVPLLQKIFNFEYPGYYHFIPSMIGAMSILLVFETIKFVYNNQLKTG